MISHTGIGGLTLGGGIGYLMGLHGLTVENLRSVDLVTADGRLMTVNQETEPELFWGLRGGGGNFGVATAFEYDLHEVGPLVLGGVIAWPVEQGREVLQGDRDLAADPPDELGMVAVIRSAPPAPFLPPDRYGKPIVGVVAVWAGDAEEGARVLAPLRGIGSPIADTVKPVPSLFVQSMLDAGAPHGLHYYFKSLLVRELPDEAIDAMLGRLEGITSPLSQLRLHAIGGKVRRIDPDSTAAGGRDAAFDVNLLAAWRPSPEREPHVAWVRSAYDDLRAHESGILPQFIAEEGAGGLRAAFGPEKLRMLTALKDRYDPENVFRLNQNVPPSGSA